MPAKYKKRMKFLFLKLPIFMALFFLMMIVALKLVERYPAPLKEGFEKYLSQTTNTNTTVERLEKAAFFPNIDIRLHNMTMHRNDNAAIIDIEADKIFISVPLSGLFIRKGKINLLDIENFTALEGVLTPALLEIESAQIVDREGPEQYGSFVIVKGRYAEKPLLIEAEIKKEKDYYIIPNDLSVSIKLGAYEVDATTEQRDGNILLVNTVFNKGDAQENIRTQATEYLFVEKNEHRENNPLSCLYFNAGTAIENCDQYLEVGN